MTRLATALLPAALLSALMSAPAPAQDADALKARVASLESVHKQTGDRTVLWLLAEAYAAAGRKSDALATLDRVTDFRMDMEPAADSFAALHGDPRYEAWAARMRAQARTVRRGRRAFVIDQPGLVPEGIAHDPRSGRLFISDMHTRRVYVVDTSGRTRVFAPPLAMQPIGLRVEPGRDRLWVATTNGFTDADAKRAELVALDLRTGRVVDRRTHAEARSFNDIALAPNGDLYATDSLGGAVFRAPASGGAMERITPAGAFGYPNGLVVTPDGRHLFVAQGVSLRRIDLATREIARIGGPPELTTYSVDGLYWTEAGLVGVQNGATRGRLIRMRLSPERDAITAYDVLEARHPDFELPTTAALAPGRAYLIANAQLRRLKPDGSLDTSVPLKPIVILDVPL